jgi:hypothetical protein
MSRLIPLIGPLIGALFVIGCASELEAPLKSFKLSEDNSGQIKIRSVSDPNCVSNSIINTCLTGKVIVNGRSVGNLSKNFQEYLTDVPAGDFLISICPPGNQICITKKGEIKPGEKKEFVYLKEFVQFELLTDLREIKQEVTQKTKTTNTEDKSMLIEDSSNRCVKLGFKTGTSSFSLCQKKLSTNEYEEKIK